MTTRRLAGPDPRPIVAALEELIKHCDGMEAQHSDYNTQDGQFWSRPLSEARAALDAWEKGNG